MTRRIENAGFCWRFTILGGDQLDTVVLVLTNMSAVILIDVRDFVAG